MLLSFSISYLDLIKLPYFAGAPSKRVVKGRGERKPKDRVKTG
jgi:hypothetical protein